MTFHNLRPENVEQLRKLFHDDAVSWPSGLSTDVFIQEIAAQGMVPLLFHRITKNNCQVTWPSVVLERLREAALRQAAAESVIETDLRAPC
ncbi:MAG: hypothetical protein CDV28_103114 [Candidatus Electronema aureum]|uniref:Uncharacterized protein n=1 Tax=Candidatus Electronema aureum TaxID=2005002 RepID=A0A521G4D1_9BACT|nr:MAG: hypothetical protein CDV28_103114 [Candidatus Electronema aureum]